MPERRGGLQTEERRNACLLWSRGRRERTYGACGTDGSEDLGQYNFYMVIHIVLNGSVKNDHTALSGELEEEGE